MTKISKALWWARQSEGSDDDIGITLQREKLPELASEQAEEIEGFDLGIHTGFSRLSEDDLPLKTEFIDTNPEVQSILERIEAGEFDYLVSWDDTRLARDGFFQVIKHACVRGDCEIIYYEEIDDSDPMHQMRRVFERVVKLMEMKKAHMAKLRMQEQGRPDGRPPYGLRYSADKTELVPDEGEWNEVVRILQLDDDGESQRGIARQVEPSRSTVRRVINDREDYEEFLLEAE